MSEHGILDVPWHLYDQLGNEFGVDKQRIESSRFFIQPLASRVGLVGSVTFEHWIDGMRRRRRRFCLLPAVPRNRSERGDFLLEIESFENSQREQCCVAKWPSSGLNLGFAGTPFVRMVLSEAQRLYAVATDYEAALLAD